MAKKQTRIVGVYRSAGRSELSLIIPPVLLYAAVVWSLGYLKRELVAAGSDAAFIDWRWYVIPAAVLLVLPIWGKFKAVAFARFVVTADAVSEERGLFSRRSSEVRICDIRNITVERSLLDRLLGIGDVSFSSAARDGDEVRFTRVARPTHIRELVREIQELEKKGEVSDADVERLRGDAAAAASAPEAQQLPASGRPSARAETAARVETAAAGVAAARPAAARPSARPAAPAPAPKPEGGGDARDELYRLLAEQEAEGKSDE